MRLLSNNFLFFASPSWQYVPRITQSLAGQVVVQVTCGSYHTAAVTGNGDLYTW
jgi:RCC1 and BTB domain-containing protein